MAEADAEQRKRKPRHQPPVSFVGMEAQIQRSQPNFWVTFRALHALDPDLDLGGWQQHPIWLRVIREDGTILPPKKAKVTSGQEIRWTFDPPLDPEEKITVVLALSEEALRRLVS